MTHTDNDPAIYTGPERRCDHEGRKRLDQMSREELIQELMVDALTGALTARAFAELEREIPSVCLAIFDVDNLKHVNDLWGHQAGDAMLNAFVRCCYEERLVPYRVGGDEFAFRFREAEEGSDLWRRFVTLQRRFRHAVWSWQDEGGNTRAATGAGVSFGFGPTRERAEAHLGRMKCCRAEAGTRVDPRDWHTRNRRHPRDLRLLSDADTVRWLLRAASEAA